MILERFVSGRARSNAYLFAPRDERCVVVDPGVGAGRQIDRSMQERGLRPQAVLLTHGHPDHVWSARSLCERYSIPAYLHPADRRWLGDPACGGYLPLVKIPGSALGRLCRLVPADVREPSSPLELAGATFDVVSTPGHTPGGVCYRVEDVCFTGDTLFAGGPGHTGYPGGSRTELRRSISHLLDVLEDDVRLLPGHGPETTGDRARRRLNHSSPQAR